MSPHPQRGNSQRVIELKQEAMDNLNKGVHEFLLDMRRLARRERELVRQQVNRWLRDHQMYGETRYDRTSETLSVVVLGKRGEGPESLEEE